MLYEYDCLRAVTCLNSSSRLWEQSDGGQCSQRISRRMYRVCQVLLFMYG